VAVIGRSFIKRPPPPPPPPSQSPWAGRVRWRTDRPRPGRANGGLVGRYGPGRAAAIPGRDCPRKKLSWLLEHTAALYRRETSARTATCSTPASRSIRAAARQYTPFFLKKFAPPPTQRAPAKRVSYVPRLVYLTRRGQDILAR